MLLATACSFLNASSRCLQSSHASDLGLQGGQLISQAGHYSPLEVHTDELAMRTAAHGSQQVPAIVSSMLMLVWVL